MADRQVSWKILADFARARREAKKTADVLEDLEDATESYNETSVAGDKKATASGKARTSSIREQIAALQRLRRERKTNATTEKSAAATAENLTNSIVKNTQALGSQVRAMREARAARKALADEERRATATSEALTRAQERLGAAELSRQRTALALEAAQRRLLAVEKSAGKESQKYADALLSVQRASLEVERAERNHMSITRQVAVAQDEAVRSSNRLASATRGLATNMLSVNSSFGMFSRVLRFIKWPAIAAGIGALITGVSQLSAGLIALSGPLLSTVNTLAALPQALSVAAGAAATFVGAFSGIGDALKQGIAVQEDAAQAAKDLGEAERNAARQIADATRRVADARRAAKDQARQNAFAIRNAEQAVIDAEKRAEQAHRAVNEARKQARQEVEDYTRALRDLEMQEEGAAISLGEARARLQEVLIDPNATDLQKRAAELAVREAEARLGDVRDENKKTQKAAAEARSKDINDSQLVIDARERETEALEAVREAERSLIRTRADARRSSAEAARSIKDALRGVADAQRQATKATESATTTQTKFQQAMENLSPEGRKFVRLLIGMRDELDRLRFAAQRGLLPGLGRAMTQMTELVPLASRGLESFGRIIGRFAERAADMLTSPEFMPMWNRLLEDNKDLLRISGRAMLNLLEAVVYLMDAARPFTKWLFRTIEGWTEYWKEISKAGNQTGRTADKLEKVKRVLKILGESLGNLWGTFKNIGKAGEDLGMDLLRSFRRITKGWEKWTGSQEGKNQLKEWFDNARPALRETSKLLGALMRMFFDMGRKNDISPLIKQIRTELLPPLEELLTNLQGDFAESLVSALTEVIDLFATLVEGGGGLATFLDIIGMVAGFIDDIAESKAGGAILTGIVTALGALAAMRFIGMITGISFLLKRLPALGKALRLFTGKPAAGKHAAESRSAFQMVGKGMASGISKGWAIGSKTVYPAIATGLRKLVVAAKRTLGIRSPSTVFIAIGRMIAAGLARGMQMSTGMVAAAASSMTGTAVVAGRTTAAAAGRGGSRRGGGRKATGGGVRRIPGGSKRPPRVRGGAATPDKAAKGSGKLASGASKAAGAVGALTLALSFLPGTAGEVAMNLMMIGMIITGLGPLLLSAGKFFLKLLGVVGKVVASIGKYMLKFVGIVGRALMMVGRLILMANPWMLLITALIIVVALVIKHWDKIKAAVSKAVSWIVNWVKDNWDIIKWFLGPLGLLIDLVVKNWDKIKEKFSDAINGILDFIKDNWDVIKWFMGPLGLLIDLVVKNWDTIKEKFKNALDRIQSMFGSFRDGLARVWSKIVDVVKNPVKAIIDYVLNPLIGGYNKIAGFLGMGTIDKISSELGGNTGPQPNLNPSRPGMFAKGGVPSSRDTSVYPGYTPGKDVGFIGISGGEAIMRPEWTRAVGKDQIEEWNAAARRGGVSALRRKFQGNFASGGIPAVGSWNRHTSGYPWTRWAGDINVPGDSDHGNPVRAYKDGTVASVIYLGDRSYGRYIRVNHADGEQTLYAHLSSALVNPGQIVKRGDMIGRVGNLGNSSGPHLHFEIAGGNSPIMAGPGGDGTPGIQLPGWMKKIVSSVGGWVKGKINDGLDFVKGKFGDSQWMNVLTALPRSLINGFIDKITSITEGLEDAPGAGDASIAAGGTDAVRSAVQKVAAAYGWGGGAQWAALTQIISRESGWDPNAANPTSSARGLFQKMTSIHGPVENTVEGQARWGLNYIKGRYGSPSQALNFWNTNGWYADGGVVPGEGVAAYNRGGYVPGFGNRDTVPAVLTPGEFVLRRDAVARIGVSNLEQVNRGASNQGSASGVQAFHRGGKVLGMKRGARGKWVKGLEALADRPREDGRWDAGLNRFLRDKGRSLYRRNVKEVDFPKTRDRRLLEWLGDEKGRTWREAIRRFGVASKVLHGWVKGLMPQIKELGGKHTKKFLEGYAKRDVATGENIKALNERLGIKGRDSWTEDSQKALNHALAHTYNRRHGDFAYRPWKYWTPTEAAILSQKAENERQQQWSESLQQIANWGFDSLLDNLFERGIEDGLKIAVDAAGNKRMAAKLNRELELAGNFSPEEFENLIRMIAYLQSAPAGRGLRDVARYLGISDYQAVKLWEDGSKAGKFKKVPGSKKNQLATDVRSYRAGTFYANSGGLVPGTGNRDTVPAMLTPGEFVLRKEAAERLGLKNLWALNDPQKFARGGLVMAPDVRSLPTVTTAGVSARRMSAQAQIANYHTVYDIDIHNPIAEKSTYSMTKMLQRQSALKKTAGSN